MAKVYRIGRFEFNTYLEYVRALEDVKKIDKITHSVDIYEPDTAYRIYRAIEDGKIVFDSKIGRRFYTDLVKIVAKSSQQPNEPPEQKKPKKVKLLHKKKAAQAKKTKTKKTVTASRQASKERMPEEKRVKVVHTDRTRQILGGICLVAAIACFAWYFWSDYTNRRGSQANEYLKRLREEPQQTVEMISNDTFFGEDAPELAADRTDVVTESGADEGRLILPEYMPIFQENSDFAGWIKIEGTKIDNPVMLTKADKTFYLNRNFNKQEDINGTLFMDARTDLTERSTNIIIYGHNMKSGQMFGGLKKYLKEDYWQSHKQITFDTIYEKGTYEIVAVCLAQVQNQDSENFRYYDFIQADTEEEFQTFIQNIKELSVFADQEMPVFGDELLTLSTCNNYVENGRLFLVAKKCRDAE